MEFSEDEKLLMDYLDGMLDTGRQEVVENRIQADPILRGKLDILLANKEAIRLNAIRQLVRQSQSNYLQARETVRPEVQTVATSPFTRWMAVAASLLLVITVAGFTYLNSLQGNDLFEARYLSYEVSSFRGEDGQSTIATLYQDKEFQELAAGWGIETATPDLSTSDLLLLGIGRLELGRPREALAFFNIIGESNHSKGLDDHQDEADFYSLLAYIYLEEYGKAKTLIEKIGHSPAHKYAQNLPTGYKLKVRLLAWING